MAILSTLALALAAAGSVNAHGYLKYVDVGGVTYGAWDVFSDPYITPRPFRYNRRYADNGPVVGMTTNNITCNNGPNSGSGVGIITVAAGSTIKLVWDQWGSSHSGPVMNYMARCSPDCASFSGSSGSPWFKIDQMGYDPTKSPPWGSDYLAKLGAWWKVTIPPTIQAGEYLLRHEILGLHVAGTVDGAQFYPSCVHLRVTGGGSDTPSGVSLPGAYQPRDPGILAELWRINQGQVTYTAPGGPVWSKAAPGPQSAATAVQQNYTPVTHAPSTSGGSNPTTTPATTTPRTTTTTSRVTSTPVSQTTTTTSRTTTTTSRTTTTGGSGTGAALWQQCGGSGHSGPTTCASGTCVVLNPYYSQCQP